MRDELGPLRILILAVLLYIGYRLIMGNFRKSDDQEESDSSSSGKSGKITDVLVEDPVCHKLVPRKQARHLELNGQDHFFCSKECYEKFVSEQGEDA